MAGRDRDLDIFRREALEHRSRSRRQGDLLRISPGWMRHTWWLLIAVTAVAAIYLWVGRVDDYATGPALLVDESRAEVGAPAAGIVDRIEARPGNAVAAGQVIVRLRSGRGGDEEPVLIRAPIAGRLGELEVRRGQFVAAGARIADILAIRPELTVTALLPGRQRPLVRPGARLRVELSGDPHRHHDAIIDRVGDRVLGPDRADRLLGGRASAALAAGSYVRVTARLAGAGSTVDDGDCDGMTGTARVRVGSRRILLAIVPGLASVLPDHDD